MSKDLCSSLQIKYPIISPPMAKLSGGLLASAVSNSGGFGFLAVGYDSKDSLMKQIDLAQSKLSSSSDNKLNVGIGFITWILDKDPSLLEIALNYNPKAIWFSFGDYEKYLNKINKGSTKVFVQTNTTQDFLKALKNELVDYIVLQGIEAGGHNQPTMSSVCLLQECKKIQMEECNFNNKYILVAGGIHTGKQLLAYKILGADACVVGSLFTISKERYLHNIRSMLSEEAKNMIKDTESGEDTVQTGIFDDVGQTGWDTTKYKGRALKNKLVAKEQTEISKITKEEYNNSNYDLKPIYVGQNVAFINKFKHAYEIINDLVSEYNECIIDLKQLQKI